MTTTRQQITLDKVTSIVHDLWALARASFDNLPSGPIPVFDLKTKEDAKRPGIGFPIAVLNTLPEDAVLPFVMHEVAVIVTFYRTECQPTEGDLAETWSELVAAVREYDAWVDQQLANEASQATKH